MAEFKVLGGLNVIGARSAVPTAPRLRQILALLVLRANRPVSMAELAYELWGELLPRTATPTAQTYIYQLRRVVGGLLLTRREGYVLVAEPHAVDAEVFTHLAEQGRRARERGRLVDAAQLLRQALDLWTGPALAGVRTGPLLGAYVAELEERRGRVLELRLRADLELGRHRELIEELWPLVALHPFNEELHGLLITALTQSGRRDEAVRVYQRLRTLLREELGVDPAPHIHRQIAAGKEIRP